MIQASDRTYSLSPLKAELVMLLWAFLLACPLPGYCSRAGTQSTPIVVAGQPRAAIVVPDAPAESTQWAANELQRYLHLLSGAEVPILHEGRLSSSVGDQAWILIGGPDENRMVKTAMGEGSPGFAALGSDGFVLKTLHLRNRHIDNGRIHQAHEHAKRDCNRN